MAVQTALGVERIHPLAAAAAKNYCGKENNGA
jgi:hypothetical protein